VESSECTGRRHRSNKFFRIASAIGGSNASAQNLAKTNEQQKIDLGAISRPAKRFSGVFCQIAKQRFYFSRPPVSTAHPTGGVNSNWVGSLLVCGAKRNQVVGVIMPKAASRLLMMDLQIAARAAGLTSPAIARKDLCAK